MPYAVCCLQQYQFDSHANLWDWKDISIWK
jgi:hypothetical protein